MKFWNCSGCKAKEEEVEYLRALVDRLLDKAGVLDKTKLPPPGAVDEIPDEIMRLKESGAHVYGE